MLSTEKNPNALTYFANPHSAYTAFKRIVHTLMFSISIGLIITLFLLFQRYQEHWLTVQTSQPGKALASQYAMLVTTPLQNDNSEALVAMATKLTENPFVESVNIYNQKGVHLAPLSQHESVVSMLKNTSIPPTIYLENVISPDGNVIGYIRLVLNSEALLDEPLAIRAQQEQIIIVLALLCFILGVYTTRAFYKTRTFLVERDN